MSNVSAASTVVNAAQKASTFANQTVETARFEALKEPLGFIKILQFILALLAFAIAVNGSSYLSISIMCRANTSAIAGSKTFQGHYSYPYDLQKSDLKEVAKSPLCAFPVDPDYNKITNKDNNIKPSAEFFVFVGVMAFLYSFAFGIIYVFFKHKYDNIVFLPIIDFIFTCLFTLFWFAGSIAWAKAITDIKTYTDPGYLIGDFSKACAKPITDTLCQALEYPTYANIVVSCIIGFGNIILWGGDVWFVLKETAWYKTRRAMQTQQANMTNNPIANQNQNNVNGANLSASYTPNNFSQI